MGLFRKSPPPRPAPQRRVPRPWDPPETEFPAIVPISTLQFGRSEQTAIAITGMSAYSNGFEIADSSLRSQTFAPVGATGFEPVPLACKAE